MQNFNRFYWTYCNLHQEQKEKLHRLHSSPDDMGKMDYFGSDENHSFNAPLQILTLHAAWEITLEASYFSCSLPFQHRIMYDNFMEVITSIYPQHTVFFFCFFSSTSQFCLLSHQHKNAEHKKATQKNDKLAGYLPTN